MWLLAHHAVLDAKHHLRFHADFDKTRLKFLNLSEFDCYIFHENLTASPHNHDRCIHVCLRLAWL